MPDVGAGDEEIRSRDVGPDARHDKVQVDEGACGRRAVVVPDMVVERVVVECGGAGEDGVEFTVHGQVCFGGEDGLGDECFSMISMLEMGRG